MCIRCYKEYLFLWKIQKYHGVSRTNLGNGTDRLCNGVKINILRDLLVRLCVRNNIAILEGISQVNCNASIIQLAKNIGYSVRILEIYSDPSLIG